MLKRSFLLFLCALLCLSLPLSLASCKDKDTSTTTQATTTVTTATTTTTTTTTTTASPAPTNTLLGWLSLSMERGYIYRFTVEKGQEKLSFLVKKEQQDFWMAYPLSEEATLYYRETQNGTEAHLYVENAQEGLLFSQEAAALLHSQMEQWFESILPALDFTQNAQWKADKAQLSFENATTKGTAQLLAEGDSFVVSQITAEDKHSQKTLSIAPENEFSFAPLPQNETLRNEAAPILARLIFLDSGFTQIEGNGKLEIPEQETFLLTLNDSGKAPVLEGGQWQISASMIAEGTGLESDFFYGIIDGVTTLRMGDFLITMPQDQLQALTEQIVLALLEYLSENEQERPSPDLSDWPVPLSGELTPEVSNQPTSPDGVYFDEDGQLHFNLTIPDAGTVRGVIVPTANGLAVSLLDAHLTIEGQSISLSGAYTLSKATAFDFATTTEKAPVEVEMDAVSNLLSAALQTGEYPYYQVEGNMSISMTLPMIGDVALNDIGYTLLTDKESFSLVLYLKYPSLMNQSLLYMPELPLGAIVTNTSCESRLYIDGTNVYVATIVTAKYVYGISMKTATTSVYGKMPLADATDNLEVILSRMFNIDMSATITPDIPSIPDIGGGTTTPPADNKDTFALSFKQDSQQGSYKMQMSMAGVDNLVKKWSIPVEIPQEFLDVTLSATVKTDEEGISQCKVDISLSESMTLSLSGDFSYPASLDQPILPEGIAEDTAYEWIVTKAE